MQLYGSKRHSRINCRYGCCGLKEAKGANRRFSFGTSRQERTRQAGVAV